MRVLLMLTALGLAACADTFARRDDAKCRAMGAQRGTDRYDNCRMTLKENRNLRRHRQGRALGVGSCSPR